MRFTIENLNQAMTASGLRFSMDLEAIIAGLKMVQGPDTPCGPQSSVTGSSVLQFERGQIAAGQSCTFEALLSIPSATAMGSYATATSPLTVNGVVAGEPSVGELKIVEEPDSDSDGVDDSQDNAPNDPYSCRDSDEDSCDDCSQTGPDSSGGDTANDGVDADNDGICDAGEQQGDQDSGGDSDFTGDDEIQGDNETGGDTQNPQGDDAVSSTGDTDTVPSADGCSCHASPTGPQSLLWLLLCGLLFLRKPRKQL